MCLVYSRKGEHESRLRFRDLSSERLGWRGKHLQKVHQANLYLSPDEEGTMVYFAVLMSQCGRGICKDEFLDSVNLILREKRSKSNFTPATMGTVHGILKQNDILKNTVCSTSALDPARAAQASVYSRWSRGTVLFFQTVVFARL